MSVDKINSTELLNVIVSNTHTRRQSPKGSDPKDIVSIGNSQETAKSATELSWPPFFPIGDAQSIFKVKK